MVEIEEHIQEVKKENIYLWAFNVSIYDKLSKIPSFAYLTDLVATKLDQEFIKQIQTVLKIPKENVFIDKEATKEMVDKSYKEIMKKAKKLFIQNTPHLLIVYCGGHGVTTDEQQVFLLNMDKEDHALFPLEFKLRYLNRECDTKLCAIYDVCRTVYHNKENKYRADENEGSITGKEAGQQHGIINGKEAGGEAGVMIGSELGRIVGELAGKVAGEEAGKKYGKIAGAADGKIKTDKCMKMAALYDDEEELKAITSAAVRLAGEKAGKAAG